MQDIKVTKVVTYDSKTTWLMEYSKINTKMKPNSNTQFLVCHIITTETEFFTSHNKEMLGLGTEWHS